MTRASTRRYRLALALAGLAAGLVFAASVSIGPTPVSFGSYLDALFAFDPRVDAHLVVRDVRLPRAFLALLVGGCLSAAGAVMQGVTRNPLAGPSLMGLSGGASLAALAAMIAVPDLTYTDTIVASLLGAAVGYGTVLAIASLSPDGLSPTRLTLAGAVTSALLSAVTMGLLITFQMAEKMLYWTAGGIANVTWGQVTAVLPVLSLGLAGAWWLAPSITVLSLGGEVAIGLGQRAGVVRITSTICVLLLAGGAVAVAGPVSFVGLMVPHACRLLVGTDYRRLVPMSVVLGAALTGLADLGARTVLGGGSELPMGVITALVGAPFFVWLVRTRPERGLDGGAPAGVSAQPDRRPRHALAWLGAVLLASLVLGVHLGTVRLSPVEVLQGLAGDGDPRQHLILWAFRLPRVVFAVLVGAGIAITGAVFQGVLKNDLAEPGLLGVSAGANLAIVVCVGLMGDFVMTSVLVLPLAAIVGGTAATLVVSLLCADKAHSSPRLLLTGIAVSAACGAISMLLSLQIGEDANAFAVAWSAGSLNMADWDAVAMVAGALVLFAPLLWSLAPTLDCLRLGEETAIALGVRIPGAPLLLLALAVGLCGACMAFGGGVTFLGLIAPHIGRRLVGTGHAALLPASALLGAILLVLADALGGQLIPGVELPAGVMVSAIGAPYFLSLLMRRQ